MEGMPPNFSVCSARGEHRCICVRQIFLRTTFAVKFLTRTYFYPSKRKYLRYLSHKRPLLVVTVLEARLCFVHRMEHNEPRQFRSKRPQGGA